MVYVFQIDCDGISMIPSAMSVYVLKILCHLAVVYVRGIISWIKYLTSIPTAKYRLRSFYRICVININEDWVLQKHCRLWGSGLCLGPLKQSNHIGYIVCNSKHLSSVTECFDARECGNVSAALLWPWPECRLLNPNFGDLHFETISNICNIYLESL